LLRLCGSNERIYQHTNATRLRRRKSFIVLWRPGLHWSGFGRTVSAHLPVNHAFNHRPPIHPYYAPRDTQRRHTMRKRYYSSSRTLQQLLIAIVGEDVHRLRPFDQSPFRTSLTIISLLSPILDSPVISFSTLPRLSTMLTPSSTDHFWVTSERAAPNAVNYLGSL
jgi:hypothetical protein